MDRGARRGGRAGLISFRNFDIMISSLACGVVYGPVCGSPFGRGRESTPETPCRPARAQHGRGSSAHFARRGEGAKPTSGQAGVTHCGAFRESGADSGAAGIARSASAIGEIRQMIILDTNVLSALMRTLPEAAVV